MPIDMINIIGNHVLFFILVKVPKPKRFNMEPPANVKTSTPCTFSTLRIRGGMDQEPSDNRSTTIPKLSSSNFMWNGQPSATLMEEIIYPLYMGLGSIQDRGSSLYETIKQVDKGGVLANPSRAICLASGNRALLDNVEESKSRNRRAFCVILNYTDSRSWHYKFFMKEFKNDAIDVMEYILSNMVLPFSTLQINDRNTYFTYMTMAKLNLPYTLDGYHMFLDKCIELGDELKKTSTQIAIRFVEGLPEIAQPVMCVTMKKEITEKKFLFPATYGALTTLIAPASWAAKATPDPGNTDYWGLAYAHRDEWLNLIKGVKTYAPKGFVRSAVGDEHTFHISENLYGMSSVPDDPTWQPDGTYHSINMISSDGITWDNECVVCFGKGHTAKQMHNGTMLKCITLELGTKPKELIPGAGKGRANEIKEIASSDVREEIAEMRDLMHKDHSALQTIIKKFKDRKARSRSASRASSIGSVPSEFTDDNDDADSVDSQHVPHFADEVARQ